GAWAITWYDQNEGSLNFLRNQHRPLRYAFEQGFQRMFWASEWWMIREALVSSPNEYKLFTQNIGNEKNVGFFEFDADVHYKFDIAELVEGGKKRPKPVCKVIKGREKKEFGYSAHANFTEWPRQTNPTMCGTSTGNAGSPKSTTKY